MGAPPNNEERFLILIEKAAEAFVRVATAVAEHYEDLPRPSEAECVFVADHVNRRNEEKCPGCNFVGGYGTLSKYEEAKLKVKHCPLEENHSLLCEYQKCDECNFVGGHGYKN